MTFRPKTRTGKEKAISIIGAVFSIILFALSGVVTYYKFAYQITALLLAVVAVEIYMKYVASDYVYDANESVFRVYRVNGKKSICVCSLDYNGSVTKVIRSSEFEAHKKDYPKFNFCVNYCKNLFPKDYYVYMFEFNGKRSLMKFEPDEIFVGYLNSAVGEALKNKNNENH